MAKVIHYNLCVRVHHGTEENPSVEEILTPVTMGYSEANEEIAKREAWNGEYTIEDDGVKEIHQPTQEERIAELEEALEMLLSGVTE